MMHPMQLAKGIYSESCYGDPADHIKLILTMITDFIAGSF